MLLFYTKHPSFVDKNLKLKKYYKKEKKILKQSHVKKKQLL